MRKNQDKPGLNKLAGDIKSIYKRYRHGFYRPNLLLTLEKRQMFDGAAGAIVADDLIDPEIAGTEEKLPTPDAAPTVQTAEGPALSTDQEAAQQADEAAEEEAADTESSMDDENADDSAEDESSDTDSDGEATSDVVDDATDGSEEEQASNEDAEEEPVADDSGDEKKQAAPEIVQADIQAEDARAPSLPMPEVTDDLDPIEEIAPDEEPAPEYSTITDADIVASEDEDDEVTEVVFIDTAVEGYEDLLDGILNELEQVENESSDLSDVTSEEDELDALIGGMTYSDQSAMSDVLGDDPDVAQDQSGDNGTPEESEQAAAMPMSYKVGGTLVYLLDTDTSAVEQITNVLTDYNELAGIHIASHGSTGALRLGNETITSDNLSIYADDLALWGQALSENGDILLYGCRVGDGGEGQVFLDELAALTDADISASDDDTGNTQYGGDWELEVDIGAIETEELLSEENAGGFEGVLAPDDDGDTDDDGVLDINDIDDDNDGILDVDEVVTVTEFVETSSAGTATFEGAYDDEGGSIGGSAPELVDGNPATWPTWGTETVYQYDFGQVVPAGTEITLTATGGTAGQISVYSSSASLSTTGELLDELTGSPANTGNTVVLTLGTDSQFIQFFNEDEDNSYGGWAEMEYNITSGSFVDTIITDPDSDGIISARDLDSDNDGISDLQESGNAAGIALDVNSDGTVSLSEGPGFGAFDFDGDGLLNVFDATLFSGAAGSNGTTPADTDGDGVADFHDLDSDNDIVPDYVEAQPTPVGTYISNDGDVTDDDADSDGIIAQFDSNDGDVIEVFGGSFTTPEDTDGDGIADYLDIDADNDALPDDAESGYPTNSADTNGDGIIDGVNVSYANPDGDITTDPFTVLLNNDDAPTILDFRGFLDTDGDGIGDGVDIDDDNDGILDTDEGQTFDVVLDEVIDRPGGGLIIQNQAFVNSLGQFIPAGQYQLEITTGALTSGYDPGSPTNSTAVPFIYDAANDYIRATGANVNSTEVIELVFDTTSSPSAFLLKDITLLDIQSMTPGPGDTGVRDAYTWSQPGTWTPLGTGGSSSPAAATVSVDLAAPDDVGAFIILDPDGGNNIADIGQFTQVTALDTTISEVLLNMTGAASGHNAAFSFDDAQTNVSLFAFNSGGANMYWAFRPILSITVDGGGRFR